MLVVKPRNSRSKDRSRSGRSARSIIQRITELKVFTITSASLVSVTGTVNSLSNVLQGTDVNNRVGRHIYAKYLDIVWSLQLAGSPSPESVNVSLFVDSSSSGGLPAFSQVFDTGSSNAGCSLQAVATNVNRFHRLYTVDLPLSLSGPASLTGRARIRIPAKYADFEFISSATAYPITNALFLTFGSLVSSTSTNLSYSCQLCFEDS